MRVLLQRVREASVTIGGVEKAAIGKGLLILTGIEDADNDEDIQWLAHKILYLRIFDDEAGVMNKSILDIQGNLLIVSQFTLHASTRKGNRPSYIKAAKPGHAVPVYEKFCKLLQTESNLPVLTGTFGADMQISLVNDGPVTIWIDSKNKE